MSRSIVVRYQTRPEVAEENQRLVADVLAELESEDPGGIRYAAFRLADSISFVHIVCYEGDDDPLSHSTAFAEFQRGIGERLAGAPVPAEATLIGSYRFLDKATTR